MTAPSWLAGETIVQYVMGFGHWIPFVLLGYVGINLQTIYQIRNLPNKEIDLSGVGKTYIDGVQSAMALIHHCCTAWCSSSSHMLGEYIILKILITRKLGN